MKIRWGKNLNFTGGDALKGGARTVCWFKGGLGKKGGGAFEGEMLAQCTLRFCKYDDKHRCRWCRTFPLF